MDFTPGPSVDILVIVLIYTTLWTIQTMYISKNNRGVHDSSMYVTFCQKKKKKWKSIDYESSLRQMHKTDVRDLPEKSRQLSNKVKCQRK